MTEPQNNDQPPRDNVPPPGPQFQQQPQFQPQPLSPQDERTWALLAHILTIVVGFIAPLVVLLVQGERSPMVRSHAVESLNFQITVTIGYVVAWVLTFVLIGILLLPLLWIGSVVFAILATIAASKGEPYRYPFALRLVK